MSCVDLLSVAEQQRSRGWGLGAFNVVQLETAEILVSAAESVDQPIVLQISQNAVRYHGGQLAPLGKAVLEIASLSKVPTVVHLDHADDLDLIDEAIDLGFTSVMYDGSKLDYEQNVRNTISVVKKCHERSISVEAELGEGGGKDGVHAPGVQTKPHEAKKFVEDTGVDLLAVAVGSSHAMTERSAKLNNELIASLAQTLSLPLVLHGSSGVSDEGMRAAIEAGMTKINVSTHLNVTFTQTVRHYLDQNPKVVDPRKYMRAGNDEVYREVVRLLNLYSQ